VLDNVVECVRAVGGYETWYEARDHVRELSGIRHVVLWSNGRIHVVLARRRVPVIDWRAGAVSAVLVRAATSSLAAAAARGVRAAASVGSALVMLV
jgi:hypothetical protein